MSHRLGLCAHTGSVSLSAIPTKLSSMDELRRHRFENHKFSRPLMFVRGIELGATPLQVTRLLSSTDIQTDRVTIATVNGDVTPLSEFADSV